MHFGQVHHRSDVSFSMPYQEAHDVILIMWLWWCLPYFFMVKWENFLRLWKYPIFYHIFAIISFSIHWWFLPELIIIWWLSNSDFLIPFLLHLLVGILLRELFLYLLYVYVLYVMSIYIVTIIMFFNNSFIET